MTELEKVYLVEWRVTTLQGFSQRIIFATKQAADNHAYSVRGAARLLGLDHEAVLVIISEMPIEWKL